MPCCQHTVINQLALSLGTGNGFVWGQSNTIGFQVATSVLKMLQLLRYLWRSKFPGLGSATPFPAPSLLEWGEERKKTPKPEILSEVPYSLSAGLLAFATGPISKFTSVLEHLHERLGRQSRGRILQPRDLQAFQHLCAHTRSSVVSR